jgi:hypothetical protein
VDKAASSSATQGSIPPFHPCHSKGRAEAAPDDRCIDLLSCSREESGPGERASGGGCAAAGGDKAPLPGEGGGALPDGAPTPTSLLELES